VKSGTVSGSAVKGVIKNAIVDLDQFGPDNSLIRIGGGSTDAAGAFVIRYSGYTGGPVQLTVRARQSTDPAGPPTTVVCDITDGTACGVNPATNAPYPLGAEIPVPSGFQIRSCLPEPPANGVMAPVTPFTEIVVRRAAQRRATIAAESDLRTALLNAASEVSQLIGGLDVLRLEAIDLSNPTAVQNATPDQLTYSVLIAAVLRQAVVNGGDGSVALNAAISKLVADTEGGRISAGNLRNLTQTAQAQLLGLGRSDPSGLLATLADNANQADANTGGIFDPEPPSQAGADQITRAKNLIQTVRNTVQAQKDLEAPANAFENEVKAANMVFEPRANSLFESLSTAVDEAAAFFDTQSGADGTTTISTVSDSGAPQTADVTLSNSGGNANVSVVGRVRNEAINLSVAFSQDPEHSTDRKLIATIGPNSTIQTSGTGDGAKLLIAIGTATLNKSDDLAIKENLSNIADVSFALDATLSQVNVTNVSPLTFRGQIDASAVKCTHASCNDRVALGRDATIVPKHFNLTGTFANASNSFQASVTADLADAENFDHKGIKGPGDVPQVTASIAIDASLAGVPTARVVISGTLTDIAPAHGASNPLDNGPIGTVTVTVSRAADQVFRLQTTSTAVSNDTIKVVSKITNSTGATLTITFNTDDIDTDIGRVTVDGVSVGKARKLSTGLIIIRYNDGTFESLFN